MQEKQEIPEFIQGIATKKSEAEQRRAIVKKEYVKLLDKLDKKNGAKKLVFQILFITDFHV